MLIPMEKGKSNMQSADIFIEWDRHLAATWGRRHHGTRPGRDQELHERLAKEHDAAHCRFCLAGGPLNPDIQPSSHADALSGPLREEVGEGPAGKTISLAAWAVRRARRAEVQALRDYLGALAGSLHAIAAILRRGTFPSTSDLTLEELALNELEGIAEDLDGFDQALPQRGD